MTHIIIVATAQNGEVKYLTAQYTLSPDPAKAIRIEAEIPAIASSLRNSVSRDLDPDGILSVSAREVIRVFGEEVGFTVHVSSQDSQVTGRELFDHLARVVWCETKGPVRHGYVVKSAAK